jgi:hypothetical protein
MPVLSYFGVEPLGCRHVNVDDSFLRDRMATNPRKADYAWARIGGSSGISRARFLKAGCIHTRSEPNAVYAVSETTGSVSVTRCIERIGTPSRAKTKRCLTVATRYEISVSNHLEQLVAFSRAALWCGHDNHASRQFENCWLNHIVNQMRPLHSEPSQQRIV